MSFDDWQRNFPIIIKVNLSSIWDCIFKLRIFYVCPRTATCTSDSVAIIGYYCTLYTGDQTDTSTATGDVSPTATSGHITQLHTSRDKLLNVSNFVRQRWIPESLLSQTVLIAILILIICQSSQFFGPSKSPVICSSRTTRPETDYLLILISPTGNSSPLQPA